MRAASTSLIADGMTPGDLRMLLCMREGEGLGWHDHSDLPDHISGTLAVFVEPPSATLLLSWYAGATDLDQSVFWCTVRV